MATYRNIKVKKPGGGYRTQRAMVLASGKLKFVSNKHRGGASRASGESHVAKHKRKHSSTKAITRRRRSHHPAKRSHRRRRGSGGMNLTTLGIAGLGLAYLAGPKSPAPSIAQNVKKVPVVGTTFSAPAAVGLTALGINHFVWRNKWLKAAGVVGLILAATEVGNKGTDFKVQGDDDIGDYDVGDDDVGDDDVGDDDVGDED